MINPCETSGTGVGQAAFEASQIGQNPPIKTVEKTNEALNSVGQKMSSIAESIRQHAPHEGIIGSAATSVADNLQAGGEYLKQHGLPDMAEDVTQLIRRYPIPSLLVGAGLGCLIGMSLKRR